MTYSDQAAFDLGTPLDAPLLNPIDPAQRAVWRWSEIIETPIVLFVIWLIERGIHGSRFRSGL